MIVTSQRAGTASRGVSLREERAGRPRVRLDRRRPWPRRARML